MIEASFLFIQRIYALTGSTHHTRKTDKTIIMVLHGTALGVVHVVNTRWNIWNQLIGIQFSMKKDAESSKKSKESQPSHTWLWEDAYGCLFSDALRVHWNWAHFSRFVYCCSVCDIALWMCLCWCLTLPLKNCSLCQQWASCDKRIVTHLTAAVEIIRSVIRTGNVFRSHQLVLGSFFPYKSQFR